MGVKNITTGDLHNWAKQGVLLLNATLTGTRFQHLAFCSFTIHTPLSIFKAYYLTHSSLRVSYALSYLNPLLSFLYFSARSKHIYNNSSTYLVVAVRAHTPNSHSSFGWSSFTDHIISLLNTQLAGVVFMLWGAFAQERGKRIDRSKHLVLTAGHPSPLSVKSFLGCRHFSKANEYASQCRFLLSCLSVFACELCILDVLKKTTHI